MKRKIKCLPVVILLIALLSVFIWKVVEVNAKFPPTIQVEYQMGEKAIIKNTLEISIEEAEFLSLDEAKTLFEDPELGKYVEEKYLLATMRVKNISSETQEYLPSFWLEAGAFFNGVGMMWMDRINDSEATVIDPQEEKIIKVPFSIVSTRFRKDQWDTVTKRDYGIVFGLYPQKTVFVLNNLKNR